jgi:glycosyltransferase involved in cell wall biosynthesis
MERRDSAEETGQDARGAIAPARAPLSWGLCVATLNRIDAVEVCVRCALAQTRPPAELVIVDASEGWEAHRDRIAALAADSGVTFRYLRAARRSLPHQRNQGAREASANILFMIDDDAFMYEDCAERIMSVYEADPDGAIGAIACTEVVDPPGKMTTHIPGRFDVTSRGARIRELMQKSGLVRFLWREVLLMSPDRVLVPYDGARPVFRPDLIRGTGVETAHAIKFIPGFALTVRRDLVLREPFEDALLAYSPTEDTEASYRFTRHAANARVDGARIYHHHAAIARIKRRQTIELTMSNVAFYVRKRSSNLWRDVPHYYVLGMRRVLAEALKDGLSRRWTFPQLRGAIAGLVRSFSVLRAPRASIDTWYQAVQLEILSGTSGVMSPSSPDGGAPNFRGKPQ